MFVLIDVNNWATTAGQLKESFLLPYCPEWQNTVES